MASCASIPVNSTKQLPQLILKRIIQTTGLIFYDECFRHYEYRKKKPVGIAVNLETEYRAMQMNVILLRKL